MCITCTQMFRQKEFDVRVVQFVKIWNDQTIIGNKITYYLPAKSKASLKYHRCSFIYTVCVCVYICFVCW